MTEENKYETQILTKDFYKIFTGVYADFRTAAVEDYKFELEPLTYEEFKDSIEKGLIHCIMLMENQIPTAFLAYTTAISEGIELNMIHCLGNEDLTVKKKILLEEFLRLTQNERKDHLVCYPMLGSQGDFVADICNYGFNFLGLAVLRFSFDPDSDCEKILNNAELKPISQEYSIGAWSDLYLDEAVKIVHKAFEQSSDALFDARFRTEDGTKNIISRIVDGTYGEFLPEAVSVLKYNDEICGLCFVNITDDIIANIPIFAIKPEHQGKGLAKHLLKNSISVLLNWVKSGQKDFSEINTTTETDNYPALNMYRGIGFKEDYCYPQSYLPEGTDI